MKKDIFLTFLMFLGFVSCSSKNTKDIEYYEGTKIVKREFIYHSKDKSEYNFVSYYPNGNIESRGYVKGQKEDGIWEYWYADGVKKCTVPFSNGVMNYGEKNRSRPYLVFENDTLKVNVPNRLKIIGLFPGEIIGYNTAAKINRCRDEDADCDYIVVPQSGDSVIFQYDVLEKILLSNDCKKDINSFTGLSAYELSHANLYKIRETIHLSKEITY